MVTAGVAGALLAVFGAAVALGLEPRAAGGALGVGLLVADVVLPVPSSAVMAALGAAHGAVAGSALAAAGSVGAAMVGFALGRRGSGLLERAVPARERARADAWLRRWGGAAIVASRPVPILAEAVVIVAGSSGVVTWRTVIAASVAGAIPTAALYAGAGAAAVRSDVAVVGLAVVIAIVWTHPRWIRARRS